MILISFHTILYCQNFSDLTVAKISFYKDMFYNWEHLPFLYSFWAVIPSFITRLSKSSVCLPRPITTLDCVSTHFVTWTDLTGSWPVRLQSSKKCYWEGSCHLISQTVINPDPFWPISRLTIGSHLLTSPRIILGNQLSRFSSISFETWNWPECKRTFFPWALATWQHNRLSPLLSGSRLLLAEVGGVKSSHPSKSNVSK